MSTDVSWPVMVGVILALAGLVFDQPIVCWSGVAVLVGTFVYAAVALWRYWRRD